MEKSKLETEIIIVGGGLVGLTMAVVLAKEGVDVLLLDRRVKEDIVIQESPIKIDGRISDKTGDISRTYQKNDARASALSAGTKEFLDEYGIWSELKDYAGEINDILVKDRDSSLSLDFDKRLVSNQPMGYMLNNNDIYKALFKVAEQYKNLKILLGKTYANISFLDDNVEIDLVNGQKLITKLLIASDGKKSKIRELLGIKTIERDYKQYAIICNIWHEKSHKTVAIEKFFPSGPFAILPMVDVHQSAIVWTERRDKVQDFLSLDEISFQEELHKRCDESIGGVKLISEPVSYPLTLTLARKYVSHRVALIGDTKHGMHPIAGQGYNVGVRDVKILLEEIKNAKYMKVDVGSKIILDAYQRARYVDSFSMAYMTHGLNYLFSNDVLPVKLARRVGLAVVDKIPFLKKRIVKHAMFGSFN